jgi:hypothetical protein
MSERGATMPTRRVRRRRQAQATLFDAPPNDRPTTSIPPAAAGNAGPATPPGNRPAGWDAGMNTAEYAVGTLAAVAFAGILLKVLTSDSVQAALAGVVQRALG